MSRKNRIILEDKLLPVQVFFNALSDNSMEKALIAFATGVGMGLDGSACTFPGDIEEWEEPLHGIEFSLSSGEAVTISFAQFLEILEKVCQSFSDGNTVRKSLVEENIAKITRLFQNPEQEIFKPGHNSSRRV